MFKKDFCVIIPAFNEEKVIEDSLESMKKIIPANLIFVVSDGSKDQTVRLAKKAGVNVMGLRKNVGKAQAILKLLKSQNLTRRFEYILFSDADSRLSKEFIKQIKELFKFKPACIVGTVKSERHGLISAYRTYEYGLTHLVYKNAQNAIRAITVAPGCASLYRSDVVEKLDFSHGTLTEDFDWTLQIHIHKLGEVVYVPKAAVITQDPPTLKDYWKQILRWYTGFWQNIFLHRLFLPIKKINLEILILMLDGFFALGFFVYFLQFPHLFLYFLSTMLVFIILFSIFILVLLRQLWAILYVPFFPLFYFINLTGYFAGLMRYLIKRKKIIGWAKVTRY